MIGKHIVESQCRVNRRFMIHKINSVSHLGFGDFLFTIFTFQFKVELFKLFLLLFSVFGNAYFYCQRVWFVGIYGMKRYHFVYWLFTLKLLPTLKKSRINHSSIPVNRILQTCILWLNNSSMPESLTHYSNK